MANVEMTNYLEDKVLDLLFRNVAYSPPSTVYLGLATALSDDGDTITEVSGGSYARQAITFGAAASRQVQNDAAVTFPEATALWGDVAWVVLYDAVSSGNPLFYAAVSPAENVDTGGILSFGVNKITVSLNSVFGTTIANSLLDHILRNQSWTSIPTVYVSLYTAFTDEDTNTEVSGNGYARTAATSGAASAGSISNSAEVTFPAASGGNWGTVVHRAAMDAVSGGNIIMHAALDTNRAVNDTKTAKFNIGSLVHTLN